MTHRLAARLTTTLATLRDARERGATGIEYAGMILIAAVVVGAIYGAVGGADLEGKVTKTIEKVFSHTP